MQAAETESVQNVLIQKSKPTKTKQPPLKREKAEMQR